MAKTSPYGDWTHRTHLGRIFSDKEWEAFRSYFYRHFSHNESIVRGDIDNGLPNDIFLLTTKSVQTKRITLLQLVLHAFDAGYKENDNG